jgi:hypothetical protein
MKTRPVLVTCLIFFLINVSLAAHGWQGTLQQVQSDIRPLTNKDVLEMLKMPLSPEIVVAKIRSANCAFDTSAAALKDLKGAGVPEPVLLAMVQAPSAQSAAKVTSGFQLRDFVPLFQALPWPIVVSIVLIGWRERVARLLDAIAKRFESGAAFEFGGLVLGEAPNETYEPFP